jgi:hypothetical protein
LDIDPDDRPQITFEWVYGRKPRSSHELTKWILQLQKRGDAFRPYLAAMGYETTDLPDGGYEIGGGER